MQHHKVDILTLTNVCKEYAQGGKRLEVLKGLTVTFEQGKTYAITGVSGSGKSTLLHVMGGLDDPTSGNVFFNGKDIYTLRSAQRGAFLNRTIGFVFQFHYLVKELSVQENIMMMGLIRGEAKKACVHRADLLLSLVGLREKAMAYPTQLSGGEQQRVAIARALFNKPAFILADEPTGNLDSENAQRVVDLLYAAQQEWGMGIIIGSHDAGVYNRMNMIYRLCNGVVKLEKG